MSPYKDPGVHQSNFPISRLCGNSELEKEELKKDPNPG